jgi:DNA-binding SARP family transcriptional activator
VPSLPALDIVAIGPPTARIDGAPAPAEVLWRKHLALLVYLAHSPGLSRSRAHLLALIWPESPEARARHSLNEALHRLRNHLGVGRLITEGETVTLSREGLSVDAWVEEAHQRGEFLEGFSLGDSQPFDEWIESQRRQRRDAAIPALIAQARGLVTAGTPARAVSVARSARERDPLNAAALQILMEALALSGNHSAALAELRDYRRRLEAIGEKPGPALDGLAQRLTTGSAIAAAGPGMVRPTLVGRATVLAALNESLPAPGSKPRVLILLGEPGQGKTRMLEELELRATLAAITVARTRALPSDQGRAGSALRGLFRGGLLQAPGLVGAAPAQLARLASTVPELAERFPPPAEIDQGELAFALAQVLEAIAEETPVLLLLDDAQLADGASIGVLQVALARLSGVPVTLALAASPHDPDSAPELLHLQAETGRQLQGTTVGLTPLTQDELALLVEELAPWAREEPARDRLVRRLAHETLGNPFLAVTLLRGLADVAALRADAVVWPVPTQTLSEPFPMHIPQLIQGAVLEKVTRLDAAARELLGIAACLGKQVDVDLLSGVTGLSEEELAARLAVPEHLQLIAATDEGYGFPGAVVAAVLQMVGLTPGRRREFRRRAAALLAQRSDLASQLWRLELLAKAGRRETLAAEAIGLGETLLDRGDRHGARRAVGLIGESEEAVPEASREMWLALRKRLDGDPTG